MSLPYLAWLGLLAWAIASASVQYPCSASFCDRQVPRYASLALPLPLPKLFGGIFQLLNDFTSALNSLVLRSSCIISSTSTSAWDPCYSTSQFLFLATARTLSQCPCSRIPTIPNPRTPQLPDTCMRSPTYPIPPFEQLQVAFIEQSRPLYHLREFPLV